eukprot:GHVU01212455.1.p1 GENE.GHVU01212455.1~~GHVU01212455.1.p1  ORF type:complete len:319 (+),score=56.36 GHVU01212455.1:348-1304(+)
MDGWNDAVVGSSYEEPGKVQDDSDLLNNWAVWCEKAGREIALSQATEELGLHRKRNYYEYDADGPVLEGDVEEPGSTDRNNDSGLLEEMPRALCLRGLPEEVTEQDVRNAFSSWSGIIGRAVSAESSLVSIRIVRDAESQRCVGYGFVDFVDHDHARQALDEMQGLRLPGKGTPLQLHWAPALTVPPLETYQLYLGNVSPEIDDHDLLEFVRKFSKNVVSGKVIRENSTNESRGYAFVKFKEEDDALLCAKKLNPNGLGKHRLLVRRVYKRPSQQVDPRGTTATCTLLFVSNLAPTTTEVRGWVWERAIDRWAAASTR